jgi:hypothetical protein
MRSSIARTCAYTLGLCLSIALVATHANAQVAAGSPAPEIDGAAVSTGLGLLAAAILIVRARRRPK